MRYSCQPCGHDGADGVLNKVLRATVRRVAVLQQLLGKGYSVIVSDVDVLWLKNPFGVLGSAQGDFAVTLDSEEKEDGSQMPCTGVMHVRATEASRQALRKHSPN